MERSLRLECFCFFIIFLVCYGFQAPKSVRDIEIQIPVQRFLSKNSISRSQHTILHAGVEAPPKPPEQKIRTGGGDEGDGLRILTAEEVQKYAHTWSQYAPLYTGGDELEELQNIHEKMSDFSKKMKGWRAKDFLAVGLMKRRQVQVVGCCQFTRGQPYLVNALVVNLLALNPESSPDQLGVGSLFMAELKTMCMEQALYLDPSPLRQLGSSVAVYSLMGSLQVLEQDPELENPLVHVYKERIKSPLIVVDNIPEWADLGHYWYMGQTNNGVTFYFRRKLRGAVNEFEVTFEKPTAGNSTGYGTVGNPRIIKDEESALMALDIPGKSEIKNIQQQISQKLSHDFHKGC